MANDPQQPSDLQAMLARLRGMATTETKPAEPAKPSAPVATAPAPPPPAAKPQVAPAPPPAPKPAVTVAAAPPARPQAAPVAAVPPPAAKPAAASMTACPVCKAPRQGTEEFCFTCGAVYGAVTIAPAASVPAGELIKGRYEIGAQLKEYGGVSRHKGFDRSSGSPVPIVILRSAAGGSAGGEIQPGFDVALVNWPSIAWEKNLLEKANSPSLPRIIDHFTENGTEYLVEESPVGQSLWNAWDEQDLHWGDKFRWLKEAAEGLQALAKNGAIIEGIRPDIIAVPPVGRAVISDLSDLLPVPLPPNPPIRGSRYTAPEVEMARENTDARSNLYSFGAMLYALHLGRELSEQDFEKNGLPKHFIARFPDVHPMYGRLVLKTFLRDPAIRFPTDEAGKKDPTGMQELVSTLEVCERSFGHVHMEVASWTTTGIVRTGNEDAFSLIHAAESRLDDPSEYTMIVLADGMGGYEAGEIAAALCLNSLREKLVTFPQFQAVAGKAHPKQNELDVNAMKKLIYETMKEANKAVFTAPQKGIGRRGMGCTAEVVYMDGYNIVVGHIGDSRTYHFTQGRLNQITRDQTLVNRLVELGQITQEEAENHPRKNELQQAVGGRADVEPAVYSAKLRPGDWVLVCSDGLINHIKNQEILEMFQLEARDLGAEIAARRLVNFANLRGATDNTTVVVIRCC